MSGSDIMSLKKRMKPTRNSLHFMLGKNLPISTVEPSTSVVSKETKFSCSGVGDVSTREIVAPVTGFPAYKVAGPIWKVTSSPWFKSMLNTWLIVKVWSAEV